MSLTRIWNITDDVNPNVKPQNIMVLGTLLKPGRSVQVDEKALVKAHKVKKDRDAGLLFIGKNLPSSYLRAKAPARAKLPAGVAQAHAPVLTPAAPPAEPVKKVVEVVDEVKVKDEAKVKVKVEAEVVHTDAPAEEESVDEGKKKKGRK